MRKIIILMSFIFFTNYVFPQNSWNLIQSFNEDLSFVFFKNSSTGFIGTGSKILKTQDGGSTWNEITIPNLNASISKMIFVNNDFGIGVGTNGTIIISSDGGDSWIQKNIGDNEYLKSICFTNEGNLFACSMGNKIYKSSDNGETWDSKETDA